MNVDTAILQRKMTDLSDSLIGYREDVKKLRDEFDRTSSSIKEAIDEINDEDESNLLHIMYSDKTDHLKSKIDEASALLEEVQEITNNLSYKISQDKEVLG